MSDGSKEATLDALISRGKRIIVCHIYTASGLVENALFLCAEKLSETCTDCHTMTWMEKILKAGFKITYWKIYLLTNVFIVIGHTKYHNQLVEKKNAFDEI